MKFPKLRGRIIEKFGSLRKFAEVYGISASMMSYKISGRSQLTLKDIRRFCELLDIDSGEISAYFFAD